MVDDSEEEQGSLTQPQKDFAWLEANAERLREEHPGCRLFAAFNGELVAAGQGYAGDVKAVLEGKGVPANMVAMKYVPLQGKIVNFGP